MTVLSLPDYTRANPYQRELASAAGRFGVETRLATGLGERLGVWHSLRTAGFPDLLHLHWIDPFVDASSRRAALRKTALFLLQLLAARARAVRIVWTVHNVVGHESRHPGLERAAYRMLASLADGIVVHCACASEIVATAYGLPASVRARVRVVPHGSYVDSYPNAVDRDEARRRLGLSRDEWVFLSFGRIRFYKGLADLLRAFGELDARDTRLLIAGLPTDPLARAELEAGAATNPALSLNLRFVPDDEVQVFMNAADAVVLPLRHVLTSGSLVLAMSFARAVVAPRRGCIPETLGERGGLLYDPDDPTALRDAMRRATELDLLAMGRANREQMQLVPWSRVAEATCALYRECVRPRSWGATKSPSSSRAR